MRKMVRVVCVMLAVLAGTSSVRAAEEDHGVFPLSWSDDHFDCFPLVWWRYDKSCVLFPLSWWKRNQYYTLFPIWWSNPRRKLLLPLYYQDENTLVAFPLYGEVRHIDSMTDWFGPYGRHRAERPEENYDWCIPFYYRDASGWQTLLFGWDRNAHSYWFFPGFFYEERADGHFKASFWWRFFRHEYDPKTGMREIDVLFIPVWREKNADS